MKYIYTSAEFDRKLCELFEVNYVPSEMERIQLSKTKSTPPVNLGIDIGVSGKEPWNKGKKTGPLSDDHKTSLSIAAKAYTKTNEHKENLSKALKGNANGKNNTKPKSDEHKEKIRQTLLKKRYGE